MNAEDMFTFKEPLKNVITVLMMKFWSKSMGLLVV